MLKSIQFLFILTVTTLTFQQVDAQSNSEKIQVTAVLNIYEGQMENFKKVAQKCIATVKEKDTGTLQYDWFLDEEKNECIVRETYASSEAILEHMANLGELLGELLTTCTLKVEVFGQPSDELLAATAEMDVKIYPFFGGLD